MSKLAEICDRLMFQAHQRRAINRHDGESARFADMTDGTQFVVTNTGTGLNWMVQRVPLSTCRTEQVYVVKKGEVQTGANQPPLTDGVLSALERSLPFPGLGRDGFAIYAHSVGQRVVTFYHFAPQRVKDALATNPLQMVGVQAPDLSRTVKGVTYLDLAKWWSAWDKGQLKPFAEVLTATKNEVRSGPKASPTLRFFVVTGPESWTGINGPALYATVIPGRTFTMEEALTCADKPFKLVR